MVSDEVNGYVRELSDDELIALTVELARRGNALVSARIPVDLAAIMHHQLVGLLEAIAGQDVAMQVREWHLTWLDRYLDSLEAQQRMAALSIFDGADSGGGVP